MASGNNTEIGITVTADTTAAVQQVRKLKEEIHDSTTASDAMGTSQKALAAEVARSKSAQQAATEAVRAAKGALDEHNLTLRAFGAGSAEATASQKRLEAAQREAAAAAKSATDQLSKAATAAAGIAQAEGKASPAVKRLATQLDKMGDEAERAAADMRKLDLQIAAAGKSSGGGEPFEGVAKGIGKVTSILAVGGAVALVKDIGHWLGEAAQHTVQFETAIANLPFGLEKAAAATRGLIGENALAVSASQAVALGVVKTEEQFAQLASDASKIALKLGTSTEEMLGDLTTALGRGSAMILDNAGIILKVSDANEAYARAVGKSVDQLDEAEKKLAFQRAAMEAIRKSADDTTVAYDSNAAALVRLNVTTDNWWDSIERGAANTAGVLAKAIDPASQAAGLNKVSRALEESALATKRWRDEAEDGPITMSQWALATLRTSDAYAQLGSYLGSDVWKGAVDDAKGRAAALDKEADFVERTNRAYKKMLAEQEAHLDYQAEVAATFGPALPPTKKKGGKKREAVSSDSDRGGRYNAYGAGYGTSDAIGDSDSIAAQAAGQKTIEQNLAEAALAKAALREQRIAGIDQELDALGTKREVEVEITTLMQFAFERESAIEAQRTYLQQERIVREQELADRQFAMATTQEARDEARARQADVKHRKRLMDLVREDEADIKRQQRKAKAFEAISGTMVQLGATVLDGIIKQKEGEKGAILEGVANFAKGIRDRMILKALEEAALGAAALAGIVTAGLAAPHFIAAGLAGAAATAAGFAGAALHTAAVNKGYGATAETGAASGGSAGAGATSSRTGSSVPASRSLEAQDIPISYEHNRRADASQVAKPVTLVVHIHGPVIGEGGKASLARELQGILDANSRRSGKFTVDEG